MLLNIRGKKGDILGEAENVSISLRAWNIGNGPALNITLTAEHSEYKFGQIKRATMGVKDGIPFDGEITRLGRIGPPKDGTPLAAVLTYQDIEHRQYRTDLTSDRKNNGDLSEGKITIHRPKV